MEYLIKISVPRKSNFLLSELVLKYLESCYTCNSKLYQFSNVMVSYITDSHKKRNFLCMYLCMYMHVTPWGLFLYYPCLIKREMQDKMICSC